MTRRHNGQFACDPISRIGRTEQQARLQQRRQAVLARGATQIARLPRAPSQCVLALTFINRTCAAMDLFGDLGDQWTVNGNTASMRLDDGRTLGLWLGEKMVEVSLEGADGVVFVKPASVERLLACTPAELAKTTHALVGEVVCAAASRGGESSAVVTRHGAVAKLVMTHAAAANGNLSPKARQLLQRVVRAVKPLTQRAAVPMSAEQKQELVTLQVKLYNLSAVDMGVNRSTALGNLIGVLLSGDADQQRKALGWT